MHHPKIIEDLSLRNRRFVFRDRDEAGARLAERLLELKEKNPLVLAIPSGGVPIGLAVANRLEAPFDLLVSRKAPLPYTREAGFGAVTWDDIVVLNEELVTALGVNHEQVDEGVAVAKKELEEKTRLLRGDRAKPNVEDRCIILTDDGLASGFTMIAAVTFVRRHKAESVVAAVPTGSARSASLIAPFVDRLFCLNIREGFSFAVADAYARWYDLDEMEVRSYLDRVQRRAT